MSVALRRRYSHSQYRSCSLVLQRQEPLDDSPTAIFELSGANGNAGMSVNGKRDVGL